MGHDTAGQYAGAKNYDTVHADGMLVMINGEFVSSHFLKNYGDHVWSYIGQRRRRERCPLCGNKLTSTENRIEAEEYRGYRAAILDRCNNCIFWELFHRDAFFDGEPTLDYTLCLSKVRSFNNVLPLGFEQELSQHIRRNPLLWHSLAPRRMEELVRDIFKANYEHCEAIHVGKPQDGGVDVIFVDAEKTQWLIQVKRRESPDSVEPVDTLRNLLGVLARENGRHGIIVSTCDHFSYRVYEEAGQAAAHGYRIELVDRGILNQMVGKLLPSRPWLTAVQQLDSELSASFRHF
jgi:hypothetical protein